jgi:L-Lysine epsilon oxidase N-terminal/L-lysine epsilon oxidase C-terminal domain
MPSTVFRVHPTINFARVGTSEHFYLSPETSAGLPIDGEEQLVGGLPIRLGTDEPITSADLRDDEGQLLRQAARFRLYAYEFSAPDRYPSGGGLEIVAGTRLADGREVADVVWTVHLANKKANAYDVVPSAGLQAYADGKLPGVRNPSSYGTVDDTLRLQQLVTDPGPRAITARSGGVVRFDAATEASFSDGGGGVARQADYPVSFPHTVYGQLYQPSGPLDSLGELQTDEQGRLLVVAAYGRTAAVYDEYGDPMPLTGDLNNDGWFDDAADGPVSATIVFTDGSTEEAFGAWVVCGDPAYAPQIRNVVSVWDDVYDAWIRELDLQPEICSGGTFQSGYRPSFAGDIHPVFRAASLQRWTANLPELAVRAHEAVDAIAADDDPDRTIMSGLAYVRNPNVDGELSVGVPLMPLSLGEAGTDFLAVSRTQYFFLEQWNLGCFDPAGTSALGPGEYLDMASLSNCLGGRYVPGIELSYPIRQPEMYLTDWRDSGSGPFRVKHKALDYGTATKQSPFLSGGWIPLHQMTDGLEPGDLSKFMSVPWQTDYNSCSIHQPSINTSGENTTFGNPSTLYWSWPSQRPDAVYPAAAVVNGVLPARVWSIRGPGTLTNDPKSSATFQKALQSVQQWDRIGVVLQGAAIRGDYPPDFFLEAESRLPTEGQSVNVVAEWPFNANPPVAPH